MDVRGRHRIDLVELPEEVSPIARHRLIECQLAGHAGVGAESADQVCTCAGLHGSELIVADGILLEFCDLLIDGGKALVVCLSLCGHRKKREEVRILLAWEA